MAQLRRTRAARIRRDTRIACPKGYRRAITTTNVCTHGKKTVRIGSRVKKKTPAQKRQELVREDTIKKIRLKSIEKEEQKELPQAGAEGAGAGADKTNSFFFFVYLLVFFAFLMNVQISNPRFSLQHNFGCDHADATLPHTPSAQMGDNKK